MLISNTLQDLYEVSLSRLSVAGSVISEELVQDEL